MKLPWPTPIAPAEPIKEGETVPGDGTEAEVGVEVEAGAKGEVMGMVMELILSAPQATQTKVLLLEAGLLAETGAQIGVGEGAVEAIA